MQSVSIVSLLVCLTVDSSWSKMYTACALANELVSVYRFKRNTIYDWVCLVEAESTFETDVLGKLNQDGSIDYGLFQISDAYWCSPPGPFSECNVDCSKLIDDDLRDDVRCVRVIYKRHGFSAWEGWKSKCRETSRGRQLLDGCTF
ncbi:Lysozyme [Halotydeus destructor]|nr:Lysozyme [Halotydeus destructor]